MNNYILPIKPGSQIGLFGGSFNPAHEWHFQVSKNALSELNLNQVIWLVSMSNPLKEDEDIMDFHDRFMSCLLYTSPSPRDRTRSRMPSSA